MAGEDPVEGAEGQEEVKQEEMKETAVALPVVFNLQRPGTLLMTLQARIRCNPFLLVWENSHWFSKKNSLLSRVRLALFFF
jgi:hypothetical protein